MPAEGLAPSQRLRAALDDGRVVDGLEARTDRAQALLDVSSLPLATLLRQSTSLATAARSFSSRSFWNSLSFSHSGSACLNDVKPRGAKAR